MKLVAQIVAAPIVLTMVAPTLGQLPQTERSQLPAVVQAVGKDVPVDGQIRQVVGKQLQSKPRRSSGLLGALGFGSSPKTQQTKPAAQPARQQSSRSLLGALFGTRDSQSSTNTTTKSTAGPIPQPADWEDVPYHSVNRGSNASAPQPIRDPNAENAAPVASRRDSSDGLSDPIRYTPARRPLAVNNSADAELTENSDPLSITSSSRRKRSSDNISSSWTRLSNRSQATEPSQKYSDDIPDLVPRVAKRKLVQPETVAAQPKLAPKQSAPKPVAPQVESQPKVASAPAAKPTPSQEIASARTQLETPRATSTPKSVPSLEVPEMKSQPDSQFVSAESSAIGSGVVTNNSANRVPSLELPTAKSDGDSFEASTPTSPQPQATAAPATKLAVAPPTTKDAYAAGSYPSTPQLNLPPIPATKPVAEPAYKASTPEPKRASPSKITNDTLRKLKPGETSASSELPGIRVITYGPRNIVIRQKHQYEVVVENRGAIDAEALLVRLMVPDWAATVNEKPSTGSVDRAENGTGERVLWKIAKLPAGKSERLFIDLRAERSGSHELDVDWTLQPQQAVAKIHVQEPKLKLTIEGPDEIIYGQSETYHVRVLNPGDGPAPNIVFTLSPNSQTPQSQSIGDIPAGKEAQFDIDLTAQDLGELRIHGLAKGDLELEADALKTIAVSSAKIQAVLSGPELKYQNTEGVYTLKIQNNGSAPSENVTAMLKLPVGVKYLGGIEGAQLEQNRLVWKIKNLPRGYSKDYECKFMMKATGVQDFEFSCKGSAAGQASVALATEVQAIADLVLTVNDPPAPAPIGSDVTYEIVVRNRGSKAATSVDAIAQFSHGIEPQRIEGNSGNVVTGQVMFDTIPVIEAGEEVRMRVIARAETGGHHRFRTEIRSADTVLVAEEATHYMKPKTDRVSRTSSDENLR